MREQASPGEPDGAQFNKRLRSLREAIEKRLGKANIDLHRLERAGVPREKLLHLLAVTVDQAEDRSWPELIRDRKEKLLSIARRLERLQPEVDRALKDPTIRLPFWAYTVGHGGLLGMKEPKALTFNDAFVGIFTLPVTMRFTAQAFRDEAKKFTWLLRRFGRADSQADIALFLLQIYRFRVLKDRLAPKHGPDCLDELARLLTDAFAVAGRGKYGRPPVAVSGGNKKRPDECFSADGLRQVWKRSGLRMLVTWCKNVLRPQDRTPADPAPAACRPAGLAPLPPLSTLSDTSGR